MSASNSTETTGCEACCGGGSCSSAFRGTPGTCCGVVDDQSFCCPTAASSFGEGQCYRPDASTFRCRAAGTSRDSGDDRPSPWYSLFSLLIPVALLAACCMACFRKPRTQQPMPVGQQYYGQGAPPPGAVYGYPATGQPYRTHLQKPDIIDDSRCPSGASSFPRALTRHLPVASLVMNSRTTGAPMGTRPADESAPLLDGKRSSRGYFSRVPVASVVLGVAAFAAVSAVSSGLVTSELAIPRSSRASTPRRALFSARERAGGGRRSEDGVIF